jgi:hypothetical protein
LRITAASITTTGHTQSALGYRTPAEFAMAVDLDGKVVMPGSQRS